MKKTAIFIMILLAAAVIISASLYFGNGNSIQGNAIANNPGNSSQSEITESALALHNTETDCWVAYQGKVYDITSWLHIHPGGVNAILPYCGTSTAFEQAFTKQHGTTKVSLLMQVGQLMGYLKYAGQAA
ncbi:MAG TPA: cytochrome b5-like heme/steroid binding domain-containing protein [Candidatus Omnitrophota bacterium]|nr:cytochrome b5-like heme/steroid binding domain-containing protein [Candidatus Omnitrophota bacterium]